MVVGERHRESTEHDNYLPDVVSLGDGGGSSVNVIRRRLGAVFEGDGDNEGDDSIGEVAKALHSKDGAQKRGQRQGSRPS